MFLAIAPSLALVQHSTGKPRVERRWWKNSPVSTSSTPAWPTLNNWTRTEKKGISGTPDGVDDHSPDVFLLVLQVCAGEGCSFCRCDGPGESLSCPVNMVTGTLSASKLRHINSP